MLTRNRIRQITSGSQDKFKKNISLHSDQVVCENVNTEFLHRGNSHQHNQHDAFRDTVVAMGSLLTWQQSLELLINK